MEPVGKPVSEEMRGKPEGHASSERGGWFFRIVIPLLFLWPWSVWCLAWFPT
jgi:hypothetical protein